MKTETKVQPLPKWAMKKYSVLWSRFNAKEFSHSNSAQTLQEKNPNLISVLFNHLRKSGWAKVKLDPTDSRKRIYELKSPEKIIEEMAK